MPNRGQTQDRNQQQRGKRQDPGTSSPDDDEAQEIDQTPADQEGRRQKRRGKQANEEGQQQGDEALEREDAEDDVDDEDEDEET